MKELDLKWEDLLDEFYGKNAVLVQIGANDGVSYGDEYLYNSIKNNPLWKSILIEPVEENMVLLKKNYFNNINVFFEQIAIGEEEKSDIILANIDKNADGGCFGALSSLKSEFVYPYYHVNFIPIPIEIKKFSYITNKYNIKKIDILQIDTEGYDYIILKQILNMNIFPKILKFEAGPMSREELDEILTLLSSIGYYGQANGDVIVRRNF